MITSVFKKSTPINLFLVVILMLVFFLIYQFQDLSWTNSTFLSFKKALLLLFYSRQFLSQILFQRRTD
jgi:hypothetical protein